ncbi:hypothetical protein ACIN8IBEIGE_100123 [Acinetobacter sp. 8I-beige]|nr:hypothetical protein ACIN8IBEIGE_100123 [Acinetobacter sp. 8I-beige]
MSNLHFLLAERITAHKPRSI